MDEALQDFDQVISIDPENSNAYADRGDVHAYAGEWRLAASDYMTAKKWDPKMGRVYQSVAWIMATCPDPKFRDTDRAVEMATRAIQLDGADDYRYLDTLAAAQANANKFQDAVKTVQQAMQVAPEEMVSELEGRLASYQQGRAFREIR